jgi:hypothetical protein
MGLELISSSGNPAGLFVNRKSQELNHDSHINLHYRIASVDGGHSI